MSGTAGSESTDETTTGGSGGGGGAGGGSPVVLSTAAQQDGNNFLEVRALFVAEMTQACGGTLCVTVVSSPSEPGDTCTYAGSDPPWSEGLLVERESVVVLIADCDGDPDPETGEEPMDDEGGGTTSEEDSGTAP
ncbi:hypothetical protein IF651_00950 [Cellulosimicrobium arenosum]|uniref:Uncharacterized protein n=2 Tax=Cellulosimicrobium arenosum TaxID=2708133 RepID=A0A927G6E8_9MICO|nr:hypothetical protein [Cellulosimicrobium arenosum]